MVREIEWSGEDEGFSLSILPPILPHFFIPRLNDKPQDPIIQTICLDKTTGIHNSNQPALLMSLVPPRHTIPSNALTHTTKPVHSLWNEAALLGPRCPDRTVSWDTARKHNVKINPGVPFLTEQPTKVFGSVQHQVQPSLHRKSTKVVQVTESDILSSLRLVVLGTSSPLHAWDVVSQSFVQVGTSEAHPPTLLVGAKDNTMSQSILQRFLDLGTLLRRLEVFIHDLRARRTNSTVYAFAHGLSTVLTFIRNRLSCGPLFRTDSSSNVHCLAAIWLHYSELEQVVASLASMCYRSIGTSPENFVDLPISPVDLLSLVYETFEMHVERASRRDITAIVAYILAVSSNPYIQDLCKSVAYGGAGWCPATSENIQLMDAATLFERDDPESAWNEESSTYADGPFPKFIPAVLADILPAAQKSLKLLHAATPNHPILSTESLPKDICWVWSEDDINTAWSGVQVKLGDGVPRSHPDDSLAERSTGDYNPEFTSFHIFDLEPGTFQSREFLERNSQTALREFVASFPNSLPSITPSPSLLCELVFSPLQSHAASLSGALLTVFLDQASFLCIDAHLKLLRSHMLLTSHSFKSRLTVALFSDADNQASQSVKMYNLLHYRTEGTRSPEQSHTGRWPVGLAPLLVTRESWPPGGSDLSFLLRTVIVDSQEGSESAHRAVPSSEGVHRVISEAEVRLGFAIRELAAGSGRERWLDPYCKALDFLYLDYKVPHPLEVLIPPGVLSKYQRIFALLLRLTRVECAIRSVFRLTRSSSVPLFPTLTSSHKLLLHFRFVAHSFLSTLSAYIYDVAIGGNFDSFLSRIATCRETADSPIGFRDVFALAECHSSVLDDILSACLLRSTQRAAGDLLRGTLEVILEFCILVGDLKDGRLKEYQASSALELLYASFRKKVSTMTKMLEVLLEKQAKSAQRPEQLLVTNVECEHRTPPGGIDSLRHLLTCINLNDWWKERS
ncbi:Spc98 family-domain-containing protein [Melanogaster broomeanus]|nr:Spc98 family-domain-containing protein [Melanogaster broomeanus]